MKIHKVYCNNCEHEIGEFGESDGRVVFIKEKMLQRIIKKKKVDVSGILAVRRRFDGQFGIECACGADSRIASQEQGLLTYTGRRPSVNQMNKILDNIRKTPTIPKVLAGQIEVDNFKFKEA